MMRSSRWFAKGVREGLTIAAMTALKPWWLCLAAALVVAWPVAAQQPQGGLSRIERRALLDALRPQAAQRTGHEVRIRVDRLNVDRGWALLIGELVTPAGGPLAWERVAECHPELDKMLWAVLARREGRWQLEHLEVCASEPPHWSLEQFGGLRWPCGVYAGLQGTEGQDLEAACRRDSAGR